MPEINLRSSVKATRLRIEKETRGITQLENEIGRYRMHLAIINRQGERDEEIETILSDLNEDLNIRMTALRAAHPELFS